MKFTTGYEFRNGTYSRWHAWELLVVSIILLVVFKRIITKPGGKDEFLNECMNQAHCSKWMSLNFNMSISLFENKLCISIKV